MTSNRIFLVYIGHDLTERGGPDPGWRMVPLTRNYDPCESRRVGWCIAGILIAAVGHRRTPYEWSPDEQPRKFAFCYREVIRDRDDTPAYTVAVEWGVEEFHRDDDCIKHAPFIIGITDPEPVQGDASVVSAPLVRSH